MKDGRPVLYNYEKVALLVVAPCAGKAVSILASIGIALIGYREGDVLEWELPAGKVKIQIDEIIYQPERLGNYDL